MIFLLWYAKSQITWNKNRGFIEIQWLSKVVCILPICPNRTWGLCILSKCSSILRHFSCFLWFLRIIYFHKWKLILSKQMLVSIFCILEKKYGCDLVGRDVGKKIAGWGTAWAEIRSQVRFVIGKRGSPKKICCIIKYSMKIFWQEVLANFSQIISYRI